MCYHISLASLLLLTNLILNTSQDNIFSTSVGEKLQNAFLYVNEGYLEGSPFYHLRISIQLNIFNFTNFAHMAS